MSIRKNPLGLVLVILHALGVIVGIYAILTLWKWVPGFKLLFNDDLQPYEQFTKLILFVFVPIGVALFCNQLVFGDYMIPKILTGVGFALMVVPALIFHIQMMGNLPTSNGNEYFGLLLIFPVICLYLVTTFQLVGKDQYVLHEDYDDALNNAGFVLPYCYTCLGIGAVTLLIGTLGSIQFFSILSMIVGFIALAVMGISRLKNGSPFEY